MLAGQTELRRSRVRYAEEWLIAATRLDPRLVQAHRELIYIYATQLRRAELNAEFTALSELTELSFDNAFHWGLLRSNSWEPGKEIEGLSRYIEADPRDRWSRLALAENYRRMGRTDDAEQTLAGLPSGEPEVIDLLARIALDRQATEKAERLLANGPKDDPLLARLRGRLALRGETRSRRSLTSGSHSPPTRSIAKRSSAWRRLSCCRVIPKPLFLTARRPPNSTGSTR